MTESERIADQLERVFQGDPWYGSNTMDVLEGITAPQAASRPIARAHTAWEIVLHMTSWNREVLRRVRSGVSRDPEAGDWREPPNATEDAWHADVRALASSFRELIDAARAIPPGRLDEALRDEREGAVQGVSLYVLLHGIIQHNTAHTAQIALLRKGF